MNAIPLDVDVLENEIIAVLGREKSIVLATCSNEQVTARAVSHINMGLDILFQTDMKFKKVEQMQRNPKVALCVGNLQVEGIAEFAGHLSDANNMEFCDIYRKKHPKPFERYGSLPGEVVIRVRPSLFTFWKYMDSKPCRDYLEVQNRKAYIVFYQ